MLPSFPIIIITCMYVVRTKLRWPSWSSLSRPTTTNVTMRYVGFPSGISVMITNEDVIP